MAIQDVMEKQQLQFGASSQVSADDTPGNDPVDTGALGTQPAGPWLLPLLLGAVLTGLVLYSQPWARESQSGNARVEGEGSRSESLAAGGASGHGGWVPAPRPVGKTVALSIDFGNGATREFAALPWRDGMTVADLMEVARLFRPSIHYMQKGSGAQAFLTALEGLAHQAKQDKYWFYEINGKRGIRSFGIQPLLPGDRVLWTFGPQE